MTQLVFLFLFTVVGFLCATVASSSNSNSRHVHLSAMIMMKGMPVIMVGEKRAKNPKSNDYIHKVETRDNIRLLLGLS
jgi:hypothetical protein